MNSNTWKTLYNEQSEEYEWMVQHEDYERNLLPALNEIHPLENADVAEFGAGTGRITAQLVPCFASWVQARDALVSLLGDASEDKMIETDEGIVIPECTGIWWCTV